jgi:DNA-binding LytR/AlgR family response regulator
VRVLVVDDEPLARRRLARMLAKLPEAELAGEAADGIEALEWIERDRPDVVLLDIRMPGLDGLSLAASRADLPPIIFTTAHDEHAVQAFEVSAVDYLLKPVKLERLRAALAKARVAPRTDVAGLREVLERIVPPEAAPIAARAGGTVRLFDPRAITRFRAEDKYVVFRQDGHDYLLDESLAALEKRLASLGFVRVHRGELVNLRHVRALHGRDDDARVELSDGQRAAVSRRFAAELRRRLGIR